MSLLQGSKSEIDWSLNWGNFDTCNFLDRKFTNSENLLAEMADKISFEF